MPRFTLSRPAVSRLVFIVLFSAWIAIALNIAFYRQLLVALPPDSLHNILVLLTMPVVAFSVINLVVTLASLLWLDSVVIALFVLAAAPAQYFIINYGIIIDRSMIVNILDTTAAESFALLTPQLIIVLLTTCVLPLLLMVWLRIRRPQVRWKGVAVRAVSLLASVLAVLLVALLFYKDYASLFRNNKELVKSLSPSNTITASLSWYSHQKLRNQPLLRIGEDARLSPDRLNGAKPSLTILVVGETSRAENFSLSGYGRQTNPLLEKQAISYFPSATSCGTATAVSLPCMFSGMPRSHYDDALAAHQEGLLDVLQRAGISVLWHENDGGCKGACDRVPSEDMTRLNLPEMCTDGECYDEVLFHGLEEYIGNLKGNGVIVLHTIGSHGPTYFRRYPPAFRKFVPTCDTNQIQDCSQQQLVNTYDNTLLYVDYIVDKAIKLLQAHQQQFTTSLVYLSDHGESLGENGVYLHGMPYAIAPDVQKHIPLLIWLSPEYQQQFAVSQSCLHQRAGTQPVSQDNLFSTVLGMTGTLTHLYQPADDLLSACRSPRG